MGKIKIITDLALGLYLIAFIIFRGGELCFYFEEPNYWLTIIVGYLTFVSTLGLPKQVFVLIFILCNVWLLDFYLFDFPEGYKVDPLAGKVVLVTGASSGTGLQVAYDVAQNNGKVYLACRNLDKCRRTAEYINAAVSGSSSDGKAVVVESPLELGSLKSVGQFVKQFGEKPIDILVNNAGFAPEAGAKQTEDGFERAFGSMHMGHFYLTKLLLDGRKDSSRQIRVVNVASGTHYACFWFDCLQDLKEKRASEITQGEFSYYRSKISNVLHAWELKNRYSDSVTSLSVNLGFVSTNITVAAQYGTFRLQRTSDIGVRPILYAMQVNIPKNMNGYIVDGVYGIKKPLSEYNMPLSGVFYLIGNALQLTHEGLIARLPYTDEEAEASRSYLWEISEFLLQEALST